MKNNEGWRNSLSSIQGRVKEGQENLYVEGLYRNQNESRVTTWGSSKLHLMLVLNCLEYRPSLVHHCAVNYSIKLVMKLTDERKAPSKSSGVKEIL